MTWKYKRLIQWCLVEWSSLLWILGLTLATSLTITLQPWPMKLLVDHAVGHATLPPILIRFFEDIDLTPNGQNLVIFSAMVSLLLFAMNAGLDAGLTKTWTSAGQRLIYQIAEKMFHRLQRLSLRFHHRHSVGDLLSRLTGDTWCIYTFAESFFIAPWQHAFTLISIGWVSWKLNSELTLLSMLVAPVMGGSVLFFGKRLRKKAQINRQNQSSLLSFVHQTVSSLAMVQTFGMEGHNRRRFRHLAATAAASAQQNIMVKNAYDLLNGLALTTGTAVILYAGGRKVLLGELSLGSLLMFLMYLKSLQSAFLGLLNIYGQSRSMEVSMDRVFEILDAEEDVRESPDARNLPPPTGNGGVEIHFNHVTFGYEKDVPVLKEIDFRAHPGEVIALVGPTGAGKSTLVSLIPRFLDPWEGSVAFNGMNLKDLKISTVRSQVVLLLQESFLLPLSIAENIGYGRPGASREEIVLAGKNAQAHEFIEKLPEGYDTVIGERGTTLSGGQRQRLAIARALLKNAPILILDEPTAALDAQSEALLFEALESLMKGRTTLIIAHRLSTIRRANQIIVLDQGRIVERGRHEELIAKEGLYHRLHELQSKPAAPTQEVFL